MRKGDNPFEPGAGTKPPELVGRDLMLEDAAANIAKGAKGRPIRGQVFYGLRGVGKTVLLREVGVRAAEAVDAIVLDLETPERRSIQEILAPELRKALIQLSRAEMARDVVRRGAGVLQSFASKFKLKIGEVEAEVKPVAGVADSGDLESDIPDLLEAVGNAAKAAKRVVLLALDEMQELKPAELSALITGIHRINQRSLPVGLFGAGLPHLLAAAGDAKSYSERLFQWVEIGALTQADAHKAIVDPVEQNSAKIEVKAVARIIEQSQCYPYFLQEWGFTSWNQAVSSPITLADVERASPLVVASLDKSFFRVRFNRVTEAERDYMRAMAELGPGPYTTGDVAGILGKSSTQVATIRAKLIEKGMVYSNQYGQVSFSVPQFDTFMRREMPDFKSPTTPNSKKSVSSTWRKEKKDA